MATENPKFYMRKLDLRGYRCPNYFSRLAPVSIFLSKYYDIMFSVHKVTKTFNDISEIILIIFLKLFS